MRRAPLLALAALLFPAPAARAQQQPVPIPGAGTELFRAFLDNAGVKPVSAREARTFVPDADTIVIVLGDPNSWSNLSNAPLQLARMGVGAGSGVLIATDTQTWYTNRAGTAQVAVAGIRVANLNPFVTHGERESCPYLVPSTGAASEAITRLFGGLNRVATNEPSFFNFLQAGGELQSTVARLPEGSRVVVGVDQFGNPVRQALDGSPPFAVAGEGQYDFLMLADHSVFINQMLIEPGTQNLEFTYRVIEYLRGPQKRSRCLFVENGKVIERFDQLRQAFAPPFPMPDLWAMQDKLTDLGNAIIDDVQSRNMLNRGLVGLAGVPSIVRLLLIILTLYGTWFLMKRMFASRKPTDLPPPPNVAGVPAGPPGVFDRRQKELIRRNNVYEPVRDLVREFFVSVGVKGDPGPKLPGVVIASTVRRPESLRQALKDFWKLAFGPPQELPVRRWLEWEPYFDRLRQAHADGKWRFTSEMA